MHPNTSKSVAQLKKKKPVKFNKLRTNLCARRETPLPPSATWRRAAVVHNSYYTVASAGSIAFHRCRGT